MANIADGQAHLEVVRLQHERNFLRNGHRRRNVGPNWVGGWLLGSGGMGTAGLWLQQSDDGNVARRMVVKIARPTLTMWNSFAYWVPYSRRGIGDPREVAAQCALTVEGYQQFVKYKAHRKDQIRCNYRIYMEFCPFGNLEDLFHKHFEASTIS